MALLASATPGVLRTGAEYATLVRRTYTLVFISVLVTIVGATYGISNVALQETINSNKLLSMLCVFIPLWAAQSARTRLPMKLGMVLLFTFAMGVIISPLLAQYSATQPGLITQAAGLTVGAFAILTGYAFLSRRDFSALGGFFSVGLWVLIGTSVLNMFFHNPTADLWLASGGVLIFSGLLVYDTSRLKNAYGPEDYVTAAVQIYLDLLNMFLFILRILGGRRD